MPDSQRLDAQDRLRLIERHDRHPHLTHRQGEQIEGFTVAGIHQHFKALPITGSSLTFTGSASSPPSLAITYIDRLSLVVKFSERALQPFSKRKRSQPRGAACSG
jgi:hypothetical protein